MIRARLVAMTGGDPAGYTQQARDSMKAAYARADERRDIAEAWARDDDVPGEGKPVSETETGTVAVIDQNGNGHVFDGDDWRVGDTGYAEILKDGKRVASFAPGFLGVYRHGSRLGSA